MVLFSVVLIAILHTRSESLIQTRISIINTIRVDCFDIISLESYQVHEHK